MDQITPYLDGHGIALLIAVLTLATALVKSERLALDPTTRANGIVQGNILAKQALAIAPVVVADIAKSADPVQIIEDVTAAVEAEPPVVTAETPNPAA